MINKKVEQLGITIEKMSYLYKGIQKRKGKSKKVELKLFKQYAAELYDMALELEINALTATNDEAIDHEPANEDLKKHITDNASDIEAVPADLITQETDEPTDSAIDIPIQVDNNMVDGVKKVWKNEVLNLEETPEDTGIKAADLAKEALADSVEAVEDGFDNVTETLEDGVEDFLAEETPTEPVADLIETGVEEETIGSETVVNKIKGIVNVPEIPEVAVDAKEAIAEGATGMETVVNKKIKGIVNVPETPEVAVEAKEAVEEGATGLESMANRVKGTVRKSSTKIFDINHQSGEVNVVTDPSKMKLPTAEPKVPEGNQDETVRMELNDILAKNKKEPSLADKLKEPVNSSATFDITFNDRFAYIKELFGGDSDAFNKAIDELASSGGYIEALTYINLNVKHKFKWKEKSPTAKKFMNLVKSKFLG